VPACRRQIGPSRTNSFKKKPDAEEWARGIEHKRDVGDHVPNAEARKYTLADAIDRYLTVALPRAHRNKNAREQTRLLNWWREQLGSRPLLSLSSAVIAKTRDELASRQSPAREANFWLDGQSSLGCAIGRFENHRRRIPLAQQASTFTSYEVR
jgi:hypothetical protein